MAVMGAGDRVVVARNMNDVLSSAREPTSFLKSELVVAVADADQWVSDNATSFNNSLTAQFRNSATTTQKARLLMYVLQQRFLAGV